MGRVMLKLTRGQRGFTLVEILLAVAILGILAAVAVPTVANIISRSETKANATEVSNIQSAVDSLMSDQELETVPTVTALNETNDMTAFPGSSTALNGDTTFGDYMRQTTTRCDYYVAGDGLVTQGTCP